MKSKNWYFAASTIWPHLTRAAHKRQTLYYENLAPLIPTNNLSVGRALGPIQDYCLDARLPPLTSIVVNKITGVPGSGFIAWDADDLSSGQKKVYSYDWSVIPNPFGKFTKSDTIQSLSSSLLKKPENSKTVYRKVPDRGVAQRVFRAALLKAYENQCAICGLTFDEALEAAHIIPWSRATPEQRLDVRNGLLLCSTHHCLFDNEYFKISPTYKVLYCDPKMKDGPYSKADKEVSANVHGRMLILPKDIRLRPKIN